MSFLKQLVPPHVLRALSELTDAHELPRDLRVAVGYNVNVDLVADATQVLEGARSHS